MNGTRKDYEQPTREEVLALVQEFLDAPQCASKNGGIAKPSERDKDEFDTLIRTLVKYRYQPDPDGDRPLRWDLCDVTRDTPHNYVHLPCEERDGSNQDQILKWAIFNLAMANEEVQRASRMLQFGKVNAILRAEKKNPEQD